MGKAGSSLIPERIQGLDPSRSVCRDVTGSKGHQGQYYGDADKGPRIEWADSVKKRGEYPCSSQCEGEADTDSHKRESESLFHNCPQHVRITGAKRNANAELAGAATGRVCDAS